MKRAAPTDPPVEHDHEVAGADGLDTRFAREQYMNWCLTDHALRSTLSCHLPITPRLRVFTFYPDHAAPYRIEIFVLLELSPRRRYILRHLPMEKTDKLRETWNHRKGQLERNGVWPNTFLDRSFAGTDRATLRSIKFSVQGIDLFAWFSPECNPQRDETVYVVTFVFGIRSIESNGVTDLEWSSTSPIGNKEYAESIPSNSTPCNPWEYSVMDTFALADKVRALYSRLDKYPRFT